MNMAGKKVLVTGGAGFIGSHMVDRLVEVGCDVAVNRERNAACYFINNENRFRCEICERSDEDPAGKILMRIDRKEERKWKCTIDFMIISERGRLHEERSYQK